MIRVLLFVALIGAVSVVRAQDTPNFSGDWQLKYRKLPPETLHGRVYRRTDDLAYNHDFVVYRRIPD